MPSLTIDGSPISVALAGASEGEPERLGETARSFGGRLNSTVRAEFRNWRFVTAPMLPLAAALLRESVARGQFVEVGGDALGPFGDSVQAEVRITEATYAFVPGSSVRHVRLALAVREVGEA